MKIFTHILHTIGEMKTAKARFHVLIQFDLHRRRSWNFSLILFQFLHSYTHLITSSARNKCLFVHNFLHRMSLITCYRKKVWLYNNTLSQNQPKWSLWGFSVLRHPNNLVLVGVNRRNVINTQQFYAAPDQANWEFFWHTDCILQL